MNFNDIPLQSVSEEVLLNKYALRGYDDNLLEHSREDIYSRVAMALASVESNDIKDEWSRKFYDAMLSGCIPAGRILANAGAGDFKHEVSTINCVVSGTIYDSMDSILGRLHESGLTLKSGCGIGYEFSTLRPRGAHIKGAGAKTSGPLSFADIYDSMCFSVSSAGGRRGAQMLTFRVDHPDIIDLIKAKREDGRLRQFNISILITDGFMEAVKKDRLFPLIFPASKMDLREGCETFPVRWPYHSLEGKNHYEIDSQGLVTCKVYRKIKAREIWDLIMRSTYDYADPGFILIDKVNSQNNLWFCENIRATNPCGEQPLPPYGSCLLGSINLAAFVTNPFSPHSLFDFNKFSDCVKIFTRMLDNVCEISGLPLQEQKDELLRKRRHGMGFTGLGTALSMLGVRYGSQKSLGFAREVSKSLALKGWETGISLAKEKGPAPIMNESFEVTQEMLNLNPDLSQNQLGKVVTGKKLIALSRYFDIFTKNGIDHIIGEISEHGSRFTHHTSIAPTGTMSLGPCNNVSNGIEPTFSHEYVRNVIKEGQSTKSPEKVYSFEALLWSKLSSELYDGHHPRPDYMVVADQIEPEEHILIQATVQEWVDSSISKTINVPTDIPFDDFKQVYLSGYELGLKGCTTFRFNPEAHTGVLVRKEDLENTIYQFILDSGEVVTLRGDEEVEYRGETHNAANLHDALKEGYYGKFS